MHVITSLTRQLQEGNVVSNKGQVLRPSVFADLYRPSTLRLVASLEFAQVASKPMPDFVNDPEAIACHDRTRAGKFWIEHGSVTETEGRLVKFAWWFPSADFAEARLVAVGDRVMSYAWNELENREFAASVVDGIKNAAAYAAAILYLRGTLPDDLVQPDQPMGVPKEFRAQAGERPVFSFCYLKGHKTVAGEHSAEGGTGRRWHHVRAHTMLPAGKTDAVWRKAHWRGDPALGVVRKVFVAKEY